jgi:flagellin FlaB
LYPGAGRKEVSYKGDKLLGRAFKKARRDQRGITGLETAIILIAFVVVAAVFSYSVISSGLFSTQKSKETIYSGLDEAKGCMELKGGMIALANTTGTAGQVTMLSFTVANAMDGAAIDFTSPEDLDFDGLADSGSTNKVVISYLDKDNRRNNLYFAATPAWGADSDSLLETGELFQVTVGQSHTQGNLVDALAIPLSSSTSFTVEVTPPRGAILTFELKTPSVIDSTMYLI